MARVAILTASDKGFAGGRDDRSGDAIEARCLEEGHEVTRRGIVPDERSVIAETLAAWCDDSVADVIFTTGGTGLTPRDVTPEATRDIAERDVPGIPQGLTTEGLKHTPYAQLSRGVAVTRGSTLVVNFPGSTGGVSDGLTVMMPLLEHIADLLAGPLEHGP